jgi:hypothetical protein
LFSRQRRLRDRELRVLRAKVDALEAERSLSSAIERVERAIASALQSIESSNAGRDSVVEHLWYKVIDQEHDVTGATERLVQLCDSLSERLALHETRQRELVEPIRPVLPIGGVVPRSSRVIGGSMFGPEEVAAEIIDLDDAERHPRDTGRRDSGWHTAS